MTTSSSDEVGLYAEQECDFEHISRLLHYKEQVTCSQDDECELSPLPGSPSYSLSKLEKETVKFVELGPWDYFLVKILGPIWMGVSFVGICGGLITAIQHRVWVARSRVCKSCKKTESDEQRRTNGPHGRLTVDAYEQQEGSATRSNGMGTKKRRRSWNLCTVSDPRED